MIVVVDASVALKWFFAGRSDEDHVAAALDILAAIDTQSLTMIQPAHFLAEIAAVLAREKPEFAARDLDDLRQIDWQVFDDDSVYGQALDLSICLDHHLFDTLYHGLALSHAQATLITADRRYYRRARHIGQISLLEDFLA